MPLAFESVNRGAIAFGFFNIDTDLLLLQQYFLFAEDFCGLLLHMAEQKETHQISWRMYAIDDPSDIGDLLSAIHGVRHSGFIGEVYKHFPFPKRKEDFKQRADGFQTRPRMISFLEKWAKIESVPVKADKETQTLSIGEYLFTKGVFHQLIQYVWAGGYPRWKDEIRPDYVMEMSGRLEKSSGWLMRGLVLR